MPTGVPNPPLSAQIIEEMSEDSGGCRLWTGRTFPTGYGDYKYRGKTVYPHRWVYEQTYGPIPDGWTVDHQCHDPEVCTLNHDCPHRRCLTPEHLKAMSNAENSMRGGSPLAHKARQTECIHGHPLSGDNLYISPKRGQRQCKTCRARAVREWEARRKEETNKSLETPLSG